MGILEQVAKHHDYFVELASVFDSEFAEDIVQEFYLLLHKYKGYCFIIIRNIHYQIYNAKKRIVKCELNEEIYNMVDDFDIEKELEWNNFRTKAESEVNNWDWYDKKLFSIYRDSNISIRGLAKETGISFVSIFHSLKKHKEKLKELLKEDYDNLKL